MELGNLIYSTMKNNPSYITKLLGLCILGSILITLSLAANYNDGPYVFSKGDNAEVWWLCNNQKQVDRVENYQGATVEKCGHKARLPKTEPVEVTQLNIEGDFKVLAASDIHGQFGLFLAMLQRHKIVDHNNRWQFGRNHFVITGDIFDRGPDVLPALW
ncbi:MAG: metallophosphoesterase, partial [Kangiellaceae bacterium]|nr:metallophosphoesterase [Kangiellaceae bacterium]